MIIKQHSAQKQGAYFMEKSSSSEIRTKPKGSTKQGPPFDKGLYQRILGLPRFRVALKNKFFQKSG